MVRITADLVDEAAQFTNACGDREVDLRDNKIQVIENMGVTRDLFDTFDLSNNDIRELDGFPLLKSLRTIIINNNRIVRVGDNLAESCPNLSELVLINNNLSDYREIKKLSTLKALTHISLLKNPISKTPHYRKFLIHHNTKLRVIDFERVKQKERQEAAALFSGEAGEALLKSLLKSTRSDQKSIAGESASTNGTAAVQNAMNAHTAAQTKAIKDAIASAKTLDEVKKIERDLLAGKMPNEVEMKA